MFLFTVSAFFASTSSKTGRQRRLYHPLVSIERVNLSLLSLRNSICIYIYLHMYMDSTSYIYYNHHMFLDELVLISHDSGIQFQTPRDPMNWEWQWKPKYCAAWRWLNVFSRSHSPLEDTKGTRTTNRILFGNWEFLSFSGFGWSLGVCGQAHWNIPTWAWTTKSLNPGLTLHEIQVVHRILILVYEIILL